MSKVKLVNEGDTFGAMVVIETGRERRKSGEGWKYFTRLLCECGRVREVETGNLKKPSFNPQCLSCSGNAGGKLKHGASMAYKDKNPEKHNCYTRWQSMKRRCYKERDSHYARYGGRGIKVCDRWLNSFENFFDDMGLPPSKNYQIDRIDNDGDYEPSNCRWVSREDNARNKSNNRMIEAFGKTQTLSAWEVEVGIKRETIAMRLGRGWSAEDALSKSKPKKYTDGSKNYSSLGELAKTHGISTSGANSRIKSESFPSWRKITN